MRSSPETRKLERESRQLGSLWLTLEQRGNSNNDFNSVAERRVEQARERLAELQRKLVGRGT